MLDNQMASYASYDSFCNAYNRIKTQSDNILTNIYKDNHTLREYLDTRICLLHENGSCLLLLVPMHDSFYELLYVCDTPDSLSKGLASLFSLKINLPIRASIVGRDEKQNVALSECFIGHDFSLGKKMMRTQAKRPKDTIIEAMRELAGEACKNVSFAAENDAPEVFAILKENFDLLEDNIPEYNDIIDNIKKKQVSVLKLDGKIASMHYFTIQNNIIYGYFDVTRKEYRGGKSLFLAISIFEHDYFTAKNMNVARSIGWRDVTNKKLVRHAEKSNQNADGIYIYNMIWKPDNSRDVRA